MVSTGILRINGNGAREGAVSAEEEREEEARPTAGRARALENRRAPLPLEPRRDELCHAEVLELGFGHIVPSEKEAANML
jgi:hypothetical protein